MKYSHTAQLIVLPFSLRWLRGFFLVLLIFPYLAVANNESPLPTNLQVKLSDAYSGIALAEIKATLYLQQLDGKLKWKKSAYTDSLGQVGFAVDFNAGTYVVGVKVFSGSRSLSRPFNQPGKIDFQVGKFKVLVTDGIGSPLKDYTVSVYEVIGEQYKWAKQGKTDDNGIIRFDLPGLEQGKIYRLKAKSPVDGSNKSSQVIYSNGEMTFQVGNQALLVNAYNALNHEPIVNLKITAKERLANGEFKWRTQGVTDNLGQVVFDLDGLGQGREYVLNGKPYNGGTVYSEIIQQAGYFNFPLGSVPVTIKDLRSGAVIPNIALTVYEKASNGKLHWKKSGTSNENGQVLFDLPGLGQGKVFIIKAKNIFGRKQKYYSPWITSSGTVEFAVSPDSQYKLDLTPPTLSVAQPKDGAAVSDTGFRISGRVSDNGDISHLVLTLEDPILGVSKISAEYEQGFWFADIESHAISSESLVRIIIKAYDIAHNMSSMEIDLSVIADHQAPQILIYSHAENDAISSKGALISGVVTDDTLLTSLQMSLRNIQQGIILSEQAIEVSKSGAWTAVLHSLPPDSQVNIQFSATDAAANNSNVELNLSVPALQQDQINLLSRITFGVTPELLDYVNTYGLESYLQEQLLPETVDDSELENFFQTWQPDSRSEMIDYQLNLSIHSKRQLLEVMTWFWENHFNTDISKTRRVEYELTENKLFRQHALGQFKDLLYASATSPAMMIYLDNVSNKKGAPNENYARELMELHTLGVDGGYTSNDVAEVARVFTGWRVKDGSFSFKERYHDNEQKQVLGMNIPAGKGMEGGVMVLDLLANHPATANHICSKLLQLFVSDKPLSSDIQGCTDNFLYSDGDITQVLKSIFASNAFLTTENFHKKFKTPLEFVASLERNLPIMHNFKDTQYLLRNMGMPLFHNPIPTGWSEQGIDWINSNQLMIRARYAGQIAFNSESKRKSYLSDPIEFFSRKGYVTGQGIVGYLFQLLLDNDYADIHRQHAMQILESSVTRPFNIDEPQAETKIRQLIAYALSLPAFQLQ